MRNNKKKSSGLGCSTIKNIQLMEFGKAPEPNTKSLLVQRPRTKSRILFNSTKYHLISHSRSK